ncbi:MAG: class I SAM-dependent methyltransferase [Pirellulales bacterium]
MMDRFAESSAASCRQQPCDLCRGQNFALLAQTDRRGRPLDTCICRDCGLVSHVNIPSDSQLEHFYREEYRQDYHGEETPSPRRVIRAWNVGRRLFSRLQPYVAPEDRLLEVGAGLGATVKQFELHGHEARGLEPHTAFSHYSRDTLGADLQSGWLFDLPRNERWDVVLLVHVIEHFRSPRQALDYIRGLLRPEGRLYIECPNLGAPFAPPGRCFHFAHIHNFTPATLAMMVERCGFAVERRFGAADDPNLMFLVRRTDKFSDFVDPTSFGQTMGALQRYNALTYHLRPNYLWRRAQQVKRYLRERLHVERQLAEILAACRTAASPTAVPSSADEAARRRRAA